MGNHANLEGHFELVPGKLYIFFPSHAFWTCDKIHKRITVTRTTASVFLWNTRWCHERLRSETKYRVIMGSIKSSIWVTDCDFVILWFCDFPLLTSVLYSVGRVQCLCICRFYKMLYSLDLTDFHCVLFTHPHICWMVFWGNSERHRPCCMNECCHQKSYMNSRF